MICLYHTCYLILDYRYYQRKIYKTYYLFPFSTHLHVLFLLKQHRRLYNFSCTKLILRNFYYLKGQKLLLPQRPETFITSKAKRCFWHTMYMWVMYLYFKFFLQSYRRYSCLSFSLVLLTYIMGWRSLVLLFSHSIFMFIVSFLQSRVAIWIVSVALISTLNFEPFISWMVSVTKALCSHCW